jgi:hypothetical protein
MAEEGSACAQQWRSIPTEVLRAAERGYICRWVWWWCEKHAWVPCKPKSGGSSPVIASIYGDDEYKACT